MMQYGIKLSTKHPFETNNDFENSNLKSIILGKKIKLFTIFQLRLKYFVIKIILSINSLPLLGFVPWVCLQFVIVVFPDHTHLLFLACSKPKLIAKKLNIPENKNSAMYSILRSCQFP